MEMVYGLLQMTIPAALVVYICYLIVRSFHHRHLDEISMTIRQKNQETVTPIRLQAYERIVLLLERTRPSNLIPRLSNSEFTAEEFHQILVHEIRNEFHHNLSQQVYMSDSAWTYVTTAVEQVISLINSSANTLPKDAKSVELARTIIENSDDVNQQAIKFVKEEIQSIF